MWLRCPFGSCTPSTYAWACQSIVAPRQRPPVEASYTLAKRSQTSAGRLTPRRTRHHRTLQEKLLFLDEMRHCYCTVKEHQRWVGLVPRPSQISCRSTLVNDRSCFGNFGLGLAWLCLPETYTSNVSNFVGDADSTRTATVNCGIHFMMGDAAHALERNVQVSLGRCAEQRACLCRVGVLA